jgi:tetratricopeptide (TPR) repeat protein
MTNEGPTVVRHPLPASQACWGCPGKLVRGRNDVDILAHMHSPYQTNAGFGFFLRLAVVAYLILAASPAASAIKAYRGEIAIPTYPWQPPVKHPYFRGTDKVNIYPYPMLDNLSRQSEPRQWRTVVLENEYLRVTFLPEMGGKIYEVLDKQTAQPVFYVNHVAKPGLIGQCGAWISGGIEWNTGPQGHTVSALQPIEVEILPLAPDGSRSVAVGETERVYRTRWTVVVTLRPGRSFLEESIRIYNATDTVRPYYFWNCTAMPNTPGFRFIYPMTLGSDHAGTKFFTWPFDHGKDLTRGTNYQDAASIFAWHCDQDFFGSYDDGVDRGVVAFANHHQLPGKKAWTWGQGGFGRMHQMDLTDSDGPYNEVQTGPLLTQAEVGRLDPLEAVSWKEWWYPVKGIGGFTFANREVAVNASSTNGQLRLRLIGTGSWSPVAVRVFNSTGTVARATCALSPRAPVDLRLALGGTAEPLELELMAGKQALAHFRVPLDLPLRQPPAQMEPPQTATEFVQAGCQDYLFAKFSEAEGKFSQALRQDAKSVAALTGLAFLKLDSDPDAAITNATRALAIDPDAGLARFALATAKYRAGDEKAALADAWLASLDPATAVPARALVAKLLLRRQDWAGAANALGEPGPWRDDVVCRNYWGLARLKQGDYRGAETAAKASLETEPLNDFAQCLKRWAHARQKLSMRERLPCGQPFEVAAKYAELGQDDIAQRILSDAHFDTSNDSLDKKPLAYYWTAFLKQRQGYAERARVFLRIARTLPSDGAFPYQVETIPVLRWALEKNPDDGKAALYLGHLLFSLGRHAEGRALWMKAVKLNASPTVALRALGMAALNLDGDTEAAVRLLQQAHDLDRSDAIIARDLARVLFQQADKTDADERKRALAVQVRDTLKSAAEAGRNRADFVALLARAHNRLGEFTETSRLLDTVRITIWEGAHEAHDLYEEAHLALGKAHLEAGRAAEALAELDRALQYPENLATGRLENTREAHIHYLRGNALSALGQKAAALAAWKKAAEEPASKDEVKESARKQAQEAIEKAGR